MRSLLLKSRCAAWHHSLCRPILNEGPARSRSGYLLCELGDFLYGNKPGFRSKPDAGSTWRGGDELASMTGSGARGVTANGCDGRGPVGD